MSARIYQPAKNAMTSGQGKTHSWVLEFEPGEAQQIDPLMGWTGSGDTQSQVRLRFETLDEAKAYAERHGIPALIATPQKRKTNVRIGGYGENFATARKEVWTH